MDIGWGKIILPGINGVKLPICQTRTTREAGSRLSNFRSSSSDLCQSEGRRMGLINSQPVRKLNHFTKGWRKRRMPCVSGLLSKCTNAASPE